jgi:hypothetical protein
MIGKKSFVAIALVSGFIGAHSLNPRELYNEMYPVETLKRDTFRLCHQVDPTFIRAVKVDREACYDSMPNAIEVALGRVHPNGALAIASLLDPSHQAELLIQLAAMPPRQAVTMPRSFTNPDGTLPPCPANGPPAVAAATTPGPGAPVPSPGRTATLGNRTTLGNLPPIPQPVQSPLAPKATLTPLSPGAAGTANGTAFDPVSTSDVGDKGPPAIVPLAPVSGCNNGA